MKYVRHSLAERVHTESLVDQSFHISRGAGIIIDTRPNLGNRALMSLIDGVVYMSR